jgi:hypothetical protein
MNRNKPDNINYNFCKLSKKESKDLKSYNKILSKIRQLKDKQKDGWSNDRHLEILKLQKSANLRN